MLSRNTAAAVAAAMLSCGPSAAQEIVGGDVTLGYSGFDEQVATADGNKRLGRLFGAASGEIGLNSMFSLQGDIGYHWFNASEEDALNVALHAVYNVNESSALGLFFGNESIGGVDSNFYGIEGAVAASSFRFEGYYLEIEEGAARGVDMVGIDAAFDVNRRFAVGVGYDQIGYDGPGDLSRLAISGEYEVEDGASLYVEIGSASADAGSSVPSLSENFLGIGVEYNLGPNRGTTFDRRSLADLIPGF